MARSAPQDTQPRRSRGRPTLDDAAAIERALLDVALRQFADHGYGATSMTSIARAAHVSKTTLYARFASKDTLFRAIMQAQIRLYEDRIALDGASATPDLAASLKAHARRMLEASLDPQVLQINRLILAESNRFPELGGIAAERTGYGIAQVTDFIRSHSGPADPVHARAEQIARVFVLMLRGLLVDVLLTGRQVPEAEIDAFVVSAVDILLPA